MAGSLCLVFVDARGQSRQVEVAGRMRLGRAPECELLLDEEGVSRVHCEVKPDGDVLELVDRGSTNGTYVNGTRVQEARVRVGDTVVLGRLVMRLEFGDAPPETYRTTYLGPAEVEVALDARDAAYPPASLSPESGRRHLDAIYGILKTIGEADNAAAMFRGALRTILDTLPFDFGHVLIGPSEEELLPVAAWAKEGHPPPYSKTVVHRVLASGQAVLANDVQSEPDLAAAKSIAAAKSLRIACAPIPRGGRAQHVGVLYVAARGLGSPVQAEDVAFLNAAARQIGLAADALTERERLARENELLKKSVPATKLVGDAEPMRRLREMVERAAQVDATVLVTGESGTGKELVARGVHDLSARAAEPFVALNCGALPGSVVTSELFGHEKGAFTGATARRIGLVELAHGGTLFLDEIGELSLDVQVMLLRLLEERRFFRVGGQEEVRADVRFVAATNRDLDAACKKGTFRYDLLFRIKVVEIRTPPLREHLEDLPQVAAWLIQELARTTGRAPKELTPAALERLGRHSWPGNVRELRNTVERALLLGQGSQIEPDDLGLLVTGAAGAAGSPGSLAPLEEVERAHVRRVLEATGWNKTRAAEILGVARITLYEKIRGWGLKPEV